MKKTLFLFMILIASVMMIGCNDENSDRIQIDFWHLWPVGDSGYTGVREIVNNFNESQDKYQVKATGFSFWDYIDKLRISIATRTAPEIAIFTIDDVESRATSGVLVNMSELMANDPNHGINFDNFFENQLNFSRYNNQYYALPFSATTRLLYYNIDMFEAAGLSEADVPKTWSELKTVAKQLDIINNNGDIVQLGFEPSYGNVNYHSYLWQTGEDFFDENDNITLNTPKHAEVLNWVKDFNSDIPRAKLTAFGEQNTTFGTSPFASERVAMIVEVDDLHQRISSFGSSFNYGVTYIPVPDDNGIRVNWGSGFSLEIYDNGNITADEKAGAWEFAKYVLGREAQIAFARATGWLMANRPAMEQHISGNALLTRIYQEVNYARDKRYIPYAPGWHGDFTPTWNSFINGEFNSAQAALEQARRLYIEKKQNYEATQ